MADSTNKPIAPNLKSRNVAAGTSIMCRAAHRLRRAFTLLELLVVIAIISILVAIIFPVFGTILENGRESNTMSNLQQIQSAMALYQLDNKRYPPVLFAYACTTAATGSSATALANNGVPGVSAGCNTGDTMTTIGGDTGASGLLVGLYPTYIKDWHVFTSPNNSVDDPSQIDTASINYFSSTTSSGGTADGRQMQSASVGFYKEDAFDSSPEITAHNQTTDPNANGYVPRYQTSWTGYTPIAGSGSAAGYDTTCFPTGATNADGTCNAADPDYIRQLRWTTPPGTTYVTSTTEHVANSDRILVLYLDGTVRKLNVQDPYFGTAVPSTSSNASTMEGQYNDTNPAITANGSPTQSPAGFWRTTLTH